MPRFSKAENNLFNTSSTERLRPKCALLCIELNIIKPIWGPPWWLSHKEPTCQCRRPRFDPWVRKISWRRKWQTTAVFLPRITRTKEPGRLHPMGSQRVGHNLVTKQQQKPILQLHPPSPRQWGTGRPRPGTRTRLNTVAWEGQSSQFSSVKTCSRQELRKPWPTMIPPRSGFPYSSDLKGVSSWWRFGPSGPNHLLTKVRCLQASIVPWE